MTTIEPVSSGTGSERVSRRTAVLELVGMGLVLAIPAGAALATANPIPDPPSRKALNFTPLPDPVAKQQQRDEEKEDRRARKKRRAEKKRREGKKRRASGESRRASRDEKARPNDTEQRATQP